MQLQILLVLLLGGAVSTQQQRTAPAADRFQAKHKVRGAVGWIRIPYAKAKIHLGSEGVSFNITADHGNLEMAAGRYDIYDVWMTEYDANGREWTICIHLKDENRPLTVRAGETVELPCSTPLFFAITRRPSYDNVIKVMYDTSGAHDVPEPDPRGIAFDVNLKDIKGNKVWSIQPPNGKMPHAAHLKIAGQDGRHIADLPFHYG